MERIQFEHHRKAPHPFEQYGSLPPAALKNRLVRNSYDLPMGDKDFEPKGKRQFRQFKANRSGVQQEIFNQANLYGKSPPNSRKRHQSSLDTTDIQGTNVGSLKNPVIRYKQLARQYREQGSRILGEQISKQYPHRMNMIPRNNKYQKSPFQGSVDQYQPQTMFFRESGNKRNSSQLKSDSQNSQFDINSSRQPKYQTIQNPSNTQAYQKNNLSHSYPDETLEKYRSYDLQSLKPSYSPETERKRDYSSNQRASISPPGQFKINPPLNHYAKRSLDYSYQRQLEGQLENPQFQQKLQQYRNPQLSLPRPAGKVRQDNPSREYSRKKKEKFFEDKEAVSRQEIAALMRKLRPNEKNIYEMGGAESEKSREFYY